MGGSHLRILKLHSPLTHNQGANLLFKMIFKAYGHKNVLGKHKTTLEFTHEDYLTKRGDCIIGIKADFKPLFRFKKRILIELKIKNLKDEIIAEFNPNFDSDEMVIRKSDFIDKRTFAIKANKAAIDIDRKIIDSLKDPDSELIIKINDW